MNDRRRNIHLSSWLTAVTLALAVCAAGVFTAPCSARERPDTARVSAAPPAKGARWCWPRGGEVAVNISPDFATADGSRQAVEAAFSHWERSCAAERNGLGVTFRFTYEDEPEPLMLTFRVRRGRIASGGQARTMMTGSPAGLITAVCVVDARVTDPAALANVMAHEIGHTFGLAECDECGLGESVMTRFNGDFNDVTSGRSAPSPVDDAAVRSNWEAVADR